MRFQVPQFIAVEDKIFGPLTIKQFVYLVGAGAASFVVYKFLPLIVAILVIPVVLGLGIALAVGKVNSMPFVIVLESAIRYTLGSKLYIWHKTEQPIKAAAKAENTDALLYVPKLSQSKLKDLTWNLDVHEAANPVTRRDGEGRVITNT
ncbi:MAG: hypothetical protein A3A13_03150 [Candidatus Yanofskybacteria bacterium RIFCSPLOWO2_01_FULL_43_22]|uniref:PrgI family protein n=1 Tax=Candidatus Yanofskybacteria bacterium RIFCSPLOWO2_01_FULL_43_22 TaxID=1802695 RepID=A0A1F8GKC4_9BACT|nr:MAG: hypothetical protein A3A13_03150 [Candidatus Yanofskybacteria bacterium RIFCSPLOWO2_01_FULL_43_22]